MMKFLKKNEPKLLSNLKKPNSKKEQTTRETRPYPYRLHKAVCENNYQAVAALLKRDKRKSQRDKPHHSDASDSRVNQQDTQGYWPIHWAVSKKFAHKNGKEANKNIAILELLLHHYQSNQVDKKGKTVLHWAIYNKHLKGVKLILKFFRRKISK